MSSTLTTKAPAKQHQNQHTKRAHAEGLTEGLVQGRAAAQVQIEHAVSDVVFAMDLERVAAHPMHSRALELYLEGAALAWSAAGGEL